MRKKLSMEYLRGAVRTEETENGLELQRLSSAIMKRFARDEHIEIRMRCPSGVRIVFRTDSPFVRLPFRYGRAARPFYEFDVFRDGRKTEFSRANGVLEIASDGALHTIEILPPHLAECFFGELELADGSVFEPVEKPAKRLLFLGDSIMQGMTVSRPSFAYADRMARHLNADYSNISIAGMTAFAVQGELAMEYEWDRMFLCFGVNDFNTGRPLSKYLGEMRGILNAVKGKPVVLISPIHMTGRPNEKNGVAFQSFRDGLEKFAAEFPNVKFVDGTKLLPFDDRYFADGLHPNDCGEDLLFNNLKELI